MRQMERSVRTAEEIYAALPEEVKVGLAEDLVELTERRLKRAAARVEAEGQGEQLEVRSAAKRRRRRRSERGTGDSRRAGECGLGDGA